MPEENKSQGFRDQVYEAALHLFATKGISGMSMRALAQVMGSSTMKTYHYFRDRDEVLAEVLTRTFAHFCNTLEEAAAAAEDAPAQIMALAEAYTGFARKSPESYHVLFELTPPEGEDYPEMRAAMARLPRLFLRQAEALCARGEKYGPAEVVAAALWGTLHGVVSLSLAGKLPAGVNPAEAAQLQIRALLAA